MKRKFITAISVLLVCGVVAFLQFQPQLVTGKKTELQQIVITEYSRSENVISITAVDDQQMMYAIYEKLQKAMPIKGNYSESQYTMIAPHYTIVLYYLDKEDEISVYKDSAGRCLREPDMFTVRKTSKINSFIESILNDTK